MLRLILVATTYHLATASCSTMIKYSCLALSILVDIRGSITSFPPPHYAFCVPRMVGMVVWRVRPRTLIDAELSVFLISEKVRSSVVGWFRYHHAGMQWCRGLAFSNRSSPSLPAILRVLRLESVNPGIIGFA